MEGLGWAGGKWDRSSAKPSWCAAFAAYCFRTAHAELGVPLPAQISARAVSNVEVFRKAGLFLPADEVFGPDCRLRDGGRRPAPGSLIIWDNHVGLLRGISPTGDLLTLEGNTYILQAGRQRWGVHPRKYTARENPKRWTRLKGFGLFMLGLIVLLGLGAPAQARHEPAALHDRASAPPAPAPSPPAAATAATTPLAPSTASPVAPGPAAPTPAPAAPALAPASPAPAAPAPAPASPAPAAPARDPGPITGRKVVHLFTDRDSYLPVEGRQGNLVRDTNGNTIYHPMVNLPGELGVALEPGTVDHLRARAESKGKKFGDVGLFLNGTLLKGANPRREPNPDYPDLLRFTLAYSAEDSATLNRILVEEGSRSITVSVGFADGEIILSDQQIDILPTRADVVASALLAVVLAVAFYLAVTRTTMLKDGGAGFSLGRTQMAWWTLLAIWGFIFIYRFTGSVELTRSVVILMGISSATALAAVVIDKRKDDNRIEAAAQVSPGPAPAPLGPAPVPAPVAGKPARGPSFLRSLMADPADPAAGLSVHRAQIVVWTLVMSYVFLDSVLGRFVMPEFDNTLLALMGVSSGTYLGFKIPEKQAAAPAPAAPAPAPVAPAPAPLTPTPAPVAALPPTPPAAAAPPAARLA